MDLSDTAPPAKPLPLVFQAVKQNTSDDSDSSHPPRRNPPAKEKISSVKLFFFSVDLYHSQALLSRTPVIQKNFFMIQKTPDDTISVSSGACLHLWKVVPPVHIKNREHGHKIQSFPTCISLRWRYPNQVSGQDYNVYSQPIHLSSPFRLVISHLIPVCKYQYDRFVKNLSGASIEKLNIFVA